MADLISRAAAVRALASSNGDYLDALERLEKIPAVDAVPVIRCRDCKYYMEHNDRQGGNCNHLDYDGEYEFSIDGDWFCADGERRDSE